MIKKSKIFEVYESFGKPKAARRPQEKTRVLYTKNLIPGKSVYQENLVQKDDVEYREWIPHKSKLAAAILKGAPNVFLKKTTTVLYLGCASGTTVSHVSDIVGEDGFIYAVDLSPTVMRDMVFLAQDRPNIAPILESAAQYAKLAKKITLVDTLYQDIAQNNQVDIFLNSLNTFVKDKGHGILCVKARSIDVTKKPKAIFALVRKQLEKHCTIVDYRDLAPYQKDHCVFIVKR